MTKKTFLFISILFSGVFCLAQCPEIICPSNITVNANADDCDAIVNYDVPLGTNPCGEGADNITIEFSYTGAVQQFVVPQNVSNITYDIAGANGGFSDKLNVTSTLHIPGNGGRLQGDLAVEPGQTLYLFVGGQGQTATNGNPGQGGFNGGGNGTNWEDNSGGGGGGATDIRTALEDLESRLIIAPGGGGAGWNFNEGDNGGHGGGQIGDNGQGNYNSVDGGGGHGATQIEGGDGGFLEGFIPGEDGLSGVGGNGALNTAGGGGGGGYFGGGGGSWAGGAGGSNFYGLSTDVTDTAGFQDDNGFIKISFSPGGPTTTTLTSGLDSGENFPVGITDIIYEAEDELQNTATCSFSVTVLDIGEPSILCPDNIAIPTDPGYCTAQVFFEPIALEDLCSSVFWEIEDEVESGDDFSLGITEIELVGIDAYGNENSCSFEIEVLDNQSPGIICPQDITVLTPWGECSAFVEYDAPYGAINCAGVLSDSTVFEFTGDIQSWIVPEGVDSISVQLFGAAGGGSAVDGVLQEDHNPGLGGFLTATLLVTPGETLFINVGGKGGDGQSGGGLSGYNGGGHGNSGGGFFGGGGGGATDIRIGGSEWSDRVLVSGGGGGAAVNFMSGDHGGPGGLEIAGNGFSTGLDDEPSVGKGGTDESGGLGGQLEGFEIGGDGAFGLGGEGAESSSGGGGGGGYYGGGGGSWAGGGGGSSFYGDSLDIIDIPGYNEGNGFAVFYYSSIEITTSMVSGLGSGSDFPIGTNTEIYMAEDELGNSVLCSFDVNVLSSFTNVFVDGTTLNAEYPDAVYQWLDCDNDFAPIAGETNPTYVVTEEGSYAVEISIDGCTDTSSCVNFNPNWIYPINDLKREFEVYPNPSQGIIHILNNSNSPISFIKVSDYQGKTVYSEETSRTTKQTINLQGVEKGLYFLEITTEENISYVRIILE